MKPNARTHDVTSTLQGERIRGTIDADAIQHIMGVLTDLYENPELAIIREYSTNALDANIEAGNDAPIEVTTPTALSPFFRVKDAGVGMNADTIREVYSKYGTSTKRGSNDVVGMLGLGCKSALTYTDQFSVASTLDEVQTLVSVSRDEDGGVSFHIVSQTKTSDPNGTEVIIPARRDNTMHDTALDFFRFWKPGTILLNGKQPEPIDGMWVDDDILITKDADGDTIVMGNVPYPAPGLNMRDRLGYYSNIVAYVPIGAVAFTPSREGLQDTEQVRQQVSEIKKQIVAKMDYSFKKQIEEADSPQEMIQRYLDACEYGYGKGRGNTIQPHDEPGWKDASGNKHRVPREFGHIQGQDERMLVVPWAKLYRRRDGDWYRSMSISNVLRSVIFTGFDAAAFSPTKRAKLDAWKAQANLDWQPDRVICVERLYEGEKLWLNDDQVYDWADVDAIKIERLKDPNGVVRPRGAYTGKQPGGAWGSTFQADTIDTSKPVYYHHGNVWTTRGHNAIRLGAVAEDKVTIVALPANRIKKFQRDFPKAKTLGEAWTLHLSQAWKPFHKDDLLALSIDTWDKKLLTRLPLSRIDDPDVRRWIKLANRKVDEKLQRVYKNVSAYTSPPDQDEENPLDKYPLLDRDYRGTIPNQIEHSIIYINAAYAAEKEAQS